MSYLWTRLAPRTEVAIWDAVSGARELRQDRLLLKLRRIEGALVQPELMHLWVALAYGDNTVPIRSVWTR